MFVTNPEARDGSPPDEESIRRELAAICASFGKAEGSRRLLTYLVECHLKGKVPRETDVALDLFHRDAGFDGSQDAVVRVAVRALRQKIEEYYHQAGNSRPLRFELPRGSYRVQIENVVPVDAPVPAAPVPQAAAADAVRHPRSMWFVALLALAVVAGLAYIVGRQTAPPAPLVRSAASTSPLWQPLLAGGRPLVVVLGDVLLFPNPHAEPGRVQLIRDSRINSRDQLREYMGGEVLQSRSGPGTNVATTLVPMSVAYGLVDVLPVLADAERTVEVRIFDELQVDRLRTHDVIFIGPLVSIGPLSDALFRHSSYEFHSEEGFRFLRNRKSGKEFRATPGRQENSQDFGLFASFRGPEGNRIMVLGSTGSDLGLLALVRGATSQQGLAQLSALLTRNGERSLPDEFEAVMSVSGFYRTDLSAQFIEAQARPSH